MSTKLGFRISTWTVLLTLTAVSAQAGTWSVGLGVALTPSPFARTDGYELQPIPFVAYEGGRFNFTVGEASFELSGGDQWYVDLDASIRFEGLDLEVAQGLTTPERDPALDLGFSFGLESALGTFELTARGDVSGVYDGQEATLSWWLPMGNERIAVVPGAGVTWKSEALVDYYYGVRAEEVTAQFPEYRGDSATNFFLSFLTTVRFTDRMWLLADVTMEQLDGSITDSPFVDRDYQISGLVGVLYRFGGSDAPKWGKRR